MRAALLRKPWLVFAVAVWATSALYFAFVVAPLIEWNTRVVSQATDFAAKYAALRSLRARHDEAMVEARNASASPMRPLSQLDLNHDIRATVNRLASRHNVTIRALRRGTETQPSEQEFCALLPTLLSSAWRDYLSFRARLVEQVTKRAAFITREVIKPMKARRVAVNLTIRACSRARQTGDETTS